MDGTQRSRLGALAVVGVLLAALAGAGLVNASPARKHSVGPTERVRAVLLSPGKHVRGPAHRRAIPRRTKNPAAERAAKQRHAREPAPRQAPSAAPNTTVFSSLNAPGLSASDNTAANQGTPPDTTGAIGPSHYVEFVNSKVRVYTRASLSTVSTADLDTFVGKSGQDVFDPQIQFDPQSNRWFYVSGDCTTSNCSRNNSLVFGWSKTSDPSDLVNGWCRYSISTGKKFDDFPKLGHDDNHILIGANVYSPTIFSNGQVWSVPTPGAGTTCPTSVTASGFNLTSAAFTPVPANTADSSTNGYIVAADYPGSGSASHIAAWHVSGSGASPVLTSDGSMTVTSFATPANVPQPGTSNVLDSSDTRLTNAVAHADPDAGGAEAVWTQHTVAGSGAASVVRWYELLPASATVRQSGTIAAGSNYAFNGAISPGSDGTSAVLDYNVGGSSQLVQIRAQSRQSGTPVGTMGGELTLGTSSAIDQDFSCSPCRWGDYAGASPDPSNGAVVWGSNQLNGPTSGTAAAWTTRNFALSAASGGSAPSVTTGSATSITQSSATLNGTVNPNGQATTYHFDYGTSTSYGSKAPPGSDPSAGSGTSDQAVSANLTGLTPGTTYHYRLVATNASGTTQGQDKTFTSSGSGYSQTILNTPGLVSYWRLGETSGSTAADAKGSDNGTYEGGVALGQPGALAGDPDTSVGFDGNTGTDMAAGVPAGMGAANASVEAWAYMPASTAKGAFTMVGNGLNGYGFGVGSGTFDNSGSHLVVLFESVRWIDTGATLTQGWHHVVLTLGGGGSPTVYLDGAQVYTDTGSPPLAPTGSVHVGGYTAAGPVARYFNGRVDEVALYTAALTPTQVSNHYTIGTGG
jgi:hypothetical protein